MDSNSHQENTHTHDQKAELVSRLQNGLSQQSNQTQLPEIVESETLSQENSQSKQGELSEKIGNLGQSPMQRYIQEILVSKGYNMEDVMDDLLQIVQKGKTFNPVTGDLEENDKIKLDALMKLAEMAGMVKAKGQTNIQINLSDIIYGSKQ